MLGSKSILHMRASSAFALKAALKGNVGQQKWPLQASSFGPFVFASKAAALGDVAPYHVRAVFKMVLVVFERLSRPQMKPFERVRWY